MRIKVMADYGCPPLWHDPIGGEIDPSDIPISDELRERLLAWAVRWDDILDWGDPGRSDFESPEAAAAFDADGRQLAIEVQQELGPAARVRYWKDPDS